MSEHLIVVAADDIRIFGCICFEHALYFACFRVLALNPLRIRTFAVVNHSRHVDLEVAGLSSEYGSIGSLRSLPYTVEFIVIPRVYGFALHQYQTVVAVGYIFSIGSCQSCNLSLFHVNVRFEVHVKSLVTMLRVLSASSRPDVSVSQMFMFVM